jgi:hypothetical protein
MREPVVTGGVGHDQGLARPLDIAQHRQRRRAVTAGTADRGGAAVVR